MPQRQIFGACGGAREVDTAYQGRLTNIGSPIQASVQSVPPLVPSKKLTAAPPAIVPNRQLLISITFFTV